MAIMKNNVMSVKVRYNTSLAAVFFIGMILVISLSAGCESSGSSDSPTPSESNNSQSFSTSKNLGQSVIMMMMSFSPTPPSVTAQAVVAASQSCADGGSMSINPDGSITFFDCSLVPGYVFDGTVKVIPQAGDTQGGRIEFNDFGGSFGAGTQFGMDGYIHETENSDGSLDFDLDLNTTTESVGESSTFDIQGNISVEDDGTMSGSMLLDNGDNNFSNTSCNFDGINAFDFMEGDNGGALMDQACEEIGVPYS